VARSIWLPGALLLALCGCQSFLVSLLEAEPKRPDPSFKPAAPPRSTERPGKPASQAEESPRATQPLRGSLSVSLRGFHPRLFIGGREIQAVPGGLVTTARVTIAGLDMEPLEATVPIRDGSGSFEIQDVPVGPNRVVTATGLDSSSRPVAGARLRAVVAIATGSNRVALDWNSSPAGDVVAALLALDQTSGTTRTEQLDAGALHAWLDDLIRRFAVPHPTLIRGEAIARSFAERRGRLPDPSTEWVTVPAGVDLEVTGLPAGRSLSARLSDPASPVLSGLGNGRHTLTPVLPGTWNLHIESPGLGSRDATLSLQAGATADMRIDFQGAGTGGGTIDFNPLPGPTAMPAPDPTPSSGNQAMLDLLIRFDR